jgi:hypothetical protein
MREYKVGDHLRVKLSGSRIVEATIKAVVDNNKSERLQVSFGRGDGADLSVAGRHRGWLTSSGLGIQNRETTHSDPPIVTTSSKRAITKSGVPSAFTNLVRAWYPPYVPASAPMVPNAAPSTIPSPPAEATHAPLNPPIKILAINPGGAVRLGVFGSLSVTSSTNAKIVKITAAVAVPIHERGLGTFSQPKCAAQAVTAGAVRDRSPAKNPIKNANSRT